MLEDAVPCVRTLRYALDTSTLYEAPPLVFDAEGVHFVLENDLLVATLSTPLPSLMQARDLVSGVLANWTLERQLVEGFADFEFAYLGANMTGAVSDCKLDCPEREPLKNQKRDQGSLIISISQYPNPPQIRASPELAAASVRLSRSRIGVGESIQSVAYFVLTLAERQAGNRRAAATRYAVSREVLERIGRLASTRGDFGTARKAPRGEPESLTHTERAWLDNAVR